MSAEKRTPGKLRREHLELLGDCQGARLVVATVAAPNRLLRGAEAREDMEFCKGNARRLAACWNACEGVSTDNLEQNLPIEDLALRYNATLRQRDELLAALRAARLHITGEALPTKAQAITQIDAAIAKATGSGT